MEEQVDRTSHSMLFRVIYFASLPVLVGLLVAWPRSYFYEDRMVLDEPVGDGDPYWYSAGGSFGRDVIPLGYGEIESGTERGHVGARHWLPWAGVSRSLGKDPPYEAHIPYWCVLLPAATPWLVRFTAASRGTKLPSIRRFGIAQLMTVIAVLAFFLSIPTAGGAGWIVLIGEVLALLFVAAIAEIRQKADARGYLYQRLEVTTYLGLAAILAMLSWDFLSVP